MKRGHSPSFISRPHRLPLPSLCLCATIKSFLCSLLLHKNQCSPFSAPLPHPPFCYAHQSSAAALPPLCLASSCRLTRCLLVLPHLRLSSCHAAGTRIILTDRRVSPFCWGVGGGREEGDGYEADGGGAIGRESDGGDRGSAQKRKRYCNGTPAGGRVSGGDIIVASPSDASSSPPDAKHPLA